MKTIILLAGIAMLAVPIGAQAQQPMDRSMTAPNLTVNRWISRVGSTMQGVLAQDRGLPHRLFKPLMAQVSFKCSQSGRPSEVTLVSPSGSAQFDMAAVRTVAAIPTLHPLPREISYDQRYRAVLFYANQSDEPMVTAKAASIRKQANRWLDRRPKVTVSPPTTLASR